MVPMAAGDRCRRWSLACSGLLVGSFLNVVIYRLPQMLERGWAAECAELLGAADRSRRPSSTLCDAALALPPCGHPIRWYENVPVLS